MISEIKYWLKNTNGVFFTVDDEWLGRPWDNVYFLENCYYDKKGILILSFKNDFLIKCRGNINYLINDNELKITSDEIEIIINQNKEFFKKVNIKFFID